MNKKNIEYGFVLIWKKRTPKKVRDKFITELLNNDYVQEIRGSVALR